MKLHALFFPEAASEIAPKVDQLYYFLTAVSVFFTVLIGIAILVFAVKYRRRSDDEKPEEIHGNNTLEVIWTVIPLGIALVMFFWGAKIYIEMQVAPTDAMEVLVTGKQWMWKIQHPTGQREINNLHLPVGQPVKLTMTSEDVIHSFFVPAFRTKQDAVPGRYTQTWFTPTKQGKYHLFCAEYCGTEHSRMVGWVYVVSPAEYEKWLSGGVGAESPVAAGEKLFASLGCVTCHSGATTAQGPNMTGIFGSEQEIDNGTIVVADEDYIRESILEPRAKIVKGYKGIMPTYKGMVSDSQLMQLIAYIKSIGKTADQAASEKPKPEPAPTANDQATSMPRDQNASAAPTPTTGENG